MLMASFYRRGAPLLSRGFQLHACNNPVLKLSQPCSAHIIGVWSPSILTDSSKMTDTSQTGEFSSNLSSTMGKLSLLNSAMEALRIGGGELCNMLPTPTQPLVPRIDGKSVSLGDISVSSDELGAPIVLIKATRGRDIAGSISHKDGIAVSAAMLPNEVAGGAILRHGVGIDIEDMRREFFCAPLEGDVDGAGEEVGTHRLRRFCAKILTPGELALYSPYISSKTTGAALALLLFSLKESVYKALHPLLPTDSRRYIGFKEVQVWLEPAVVEALVLHGLSSRPADVAGVAHLPTSLTDFDSAILQNHVGVSLLLPELSCSSAYEFHCSGYFTRYMDKYWVSYIHLVRQGDPV